VANHPSGESRSCFVIIECFPKIQNTRRTGSAQGNIYGSHQDWREFQHYKHRDPPWIRLYRKLLNDREWFGLDGDAAKVLIMCWPIASENDVALPKPANLAFRFRMTERPKRRF